MDKELIENINSIKKTGDDRYRIILDFASVKLVQYLISNDYKYVWIYNHCLSNPSSWKNRSLPILDSKPEIKIKSKNVKFDFIIETNEFVKLLPEWGNGIQMIQMNKMPPDYFEPDKIRGKQRYQILKNDCDYLFELYIPSATDYGTLISPNVKYLENLLNSPEINWNNLP
ncbi:hypothetical protein [Portibacter lacus]|uniref:Uncharacterized protein n=1 Tax=Portibacter lacus TaxID=1099794 RepID=A0AA37SUK3_9BACT|nr:hypothetical protein [Portibacter lacus]GLR18230.1 hypothetical protein GCM10007940_28450 [Portibacter lacus]